MQADVVDLSHFNGDIQFHELKALGVQGVILKATQGADYKDHRFDGYLEQARAVDFLVAAYHFLTGDDADQQFDNFTSALSGKGPLFHANDVERSNTSQPTPAILKEFIEQEVGAFSLHPVVYGSNVLHGFPQEILAGCPGWIAAYGQYRPTWYTEMKLWQYTDRDGLEGYPNVDCSEWCGDGDMETWWKSRMVSV